MPKKRLKISEAARLNHGSHVIYDPPQNQKLGLIRGKTYPILNIYFIGYDRTAAHLRLGGNTISEPHEVDPRSLEGITITDKRGHPLTDVLFTFFGPVKLLDDAHTSGEHRYSYRYFRKG